MQRLFLTILASLASSLVFGATTMYSVPNGAVEVAHVVLLPGVGEQDYFWLKEKYPSSSALGYYSRVFSGWRPCYGRQREWWSFGDQSSGEDRFIHQLSRHWVNAANDTAVTLVLKYTSSGLNRRVMPDTDRQFVAVVRYKHRNAAKDLGEIGVKCE
jgi:hypothetical protein